MNINDWLLAQHHHVFGLITPALIALALLIYKLARGEAFPSVSAKVWVAFIVAGIVGSYLFFQTGYDDGGSVRILPWLIIFLFVREYEAFTIASAKGEAFLSKLDPKSVFIFTFAYVLAVDVATCSAVGMDLYWIGGAGYQDGLIGQPLLLSGISTVLRFIYSNKSIIKTLRRAACRWCVRGVRTPGQ